MTPLEAARRLAARRPVNEMWCAVCHSDPCEPDCPWLALPQIVAALEAAERLTGGRYVMVGDVAPKLDARTWNALVAALKGETDG